MPALIGHHGTYPPEKGWDMVKLRQLFFKPTETLADDEIEYAQMWMQITPALEVRAKVCEWEEQDPERDERTQAIMGDARDNRNVGRALIYTENDIRSGRIDPEDLAK